MRCLRAPHFLKGVNMFNFLKKSNKIVAVCDGIINNLNQFPDDAISSLVLGDGFMIEQNNKKIV